MPAAIAAGAVILQRRDADVAPEDFDRSVGRAVVARAERIGAVLRDAADRSGAEQREERRGRRALCRPRREHRIRIGEGELRRRPAGLRAAQGGALVVRIPREHDLLSNLVVRNRDAELRRVEFRHELVDGRRVAAGCPAVVERLADAVDVDGQAATGRARGRRGIGERLRRVGRVVDQRRGVDGIVRRVQRDRQVAAGGRGQRGRELRGAADSDLDVGRGDPLRPADRLQQRRSRVAVLIVGRGRDAVELGRGGRGEIVELAAVHAELRIVEVDVRAELTAADVQRHRIGGVGVAGHPDHQHRVARSVGADDGSGEMIRGRIVDQRASAERYERRAVGLHRGLRRHELRELVDQLIALILVRVRVVADRRRGTNLAVERRDLVEQVIDLRDDGAGLLDRARFGRSDGVSDLVELRDERLRGAEHVGARGHPARLVVRGRRGQLGEGGLQRREGSVDAVVRFGERGLDRDQLLFLRPVETLRSAGAAEQPVVRILMDPGDRLDEHAVALRTGTAPGRVAGRTDDRRRLGKVGDLPRRAGRVDVGDVVRGRVGGFLERVERAPDQVQAEETHARRLTMTLPSGGATIPRRR